MTKTCDPITTKRALLSEIARRVHGAGRKSRWGYAVCKYAALLVEETTFKALEEAYRQHRLEYFLLDGASSWEQLGTSGGRFPFTHEDLSRLFATPSRRARFDRLPWEVVEDAIGRALYQAYAHIFAILRGNARARA